MVKLTVEQLERDSFRPYGQVIDNQDITPIMNETEFVFWNNLAQLEIDAPVDFGLLNVVERDKNFSKLERHELTAEAFFAVDQDCLMLTGQPTPGKPYPDPETVRAFHLKKGSGVVFNKGTWHWLPYPLAEKALLLVVCRQGTVDDDLEIVDLKDQGISFTIEIDS